MVLGWLWWRAWFPFVPEDAAAVCVADVAFGSIDLHSVRQAWHLATSAWQAWRLWCWAGSGGALGSRLSLRTGRLFVWQAWHLEASASILCGRRGAWQPTFTLCGIVWQVWRLWCWVGSGGALGSRLSPRTRRLFVWQTWHLEASTSILCGRRGTWRHRPGKCGAYGAGLALVARLVPVCP